MLQQEIKKIVYINIYIIIIFKFTLKSTTTTHKMKQ